MSVPMKCPNPNCVFCFDASQIPPGTYLACPQCRVQFTMPMPMPGYSLAPGYGAPPQTNTAQPPGNDNSDQFSFSSGLDDSVEQEADIREEPRNKTTAKSGSRRPDTKVHQTKHGEPEKRTPSDKNTNGVDDDDEKLKPGSGNWKIIVAAVLGVLVLCGSLAGYLILRGKNKQPRDETGKELKFQNFAVEFVNPELTGWERDRNFDAGKSKLQMNMLLFQKLENTEVPVGWIGFHAKKVPSTPPTAEIEAIILQMLRNGFDEIPEQLTATEDGKLLGKPATKFEFRGVYKTGDEGQTCTGEVHAVVTLGNLYLTFAWGTDQSFGGLTRDFATMRSGLRVISGASGTETRAVQRDFRAKGRQSYGLFVVTDYEGRWYQNSDREPSLRDPKAELYLEGWENLSRRPPNRNPPAELLVCVLEDKGDPKANAEEHIISVLAPSETKPTFDVMDGEPTGDPAKVTNIAPASVVTRGRLKIPGSDSSVNKLVVYATMSNNGKLILAYATCQSKELAAWEQRLMLIVGSLRKP